jgi:predicted CoA-binding protein
LAADSEIRSSRAVAVRPHLPQAHNRYVPDGAEVLQATECVLLIDWPNRDVPDSLARAGYRVASKEGPGVEDYKAYELNGAEVVTRNLGAEPDHADLVYTYRPFDELPEIVEFARHIGARAIWNETGPNTPGADRARQMVESAGLTYIDAPRITDAVRQQPRSR